MPPQHGKSELISKYFACWWLGWHPEDKILIASYGAAIAEELGDHNRKLFKRWGQELFGLDIDRTTNSKGQWKIDGHRGEMRCVGVGGAMAGFSCDLGIIDDPIKNRQQAQSHAARKRIKDWYHNDFETRLSERARVVVVQTRWHEDDLTGHLITTAEESGEIWVRLELPALAYWPAEIPEEEHPQAFPDPLGRKPGEALCPELHSQAKLEMRREGMESEAHWWSLYQCRPRPGSGGIYGDIDTWPRWGQGQIWFAYDPGKQGYYYNSNLRYDEVIQSWDCTWKDALSSDFVVGGVWARKGTQLFLLEVLRRRMDLEGTCEAIKLMKQRYPMTSTILVEGKANGPQIIKRLRSVVPGVVPCDPKGTKVERAEATKYRVQDIFLPPRGKYGWLQPFCAELGAFPFATYDDQVDMMTQALQHFIDHEGGSTAGARTAPRTNGIRAALRRNLPT